MTELHFRAKFTSQHAHSSQNYSQLSGYHCACQLLMNLSIIFRSISYLLLILATAMGIAVIAGYSIPAGPTHNNEIALKSWLICISITLFSAFILYGGSRYLKKSNDQQMLRKEAIAIAGITVFAPSAVKPDSKPLTSNVGRPQTRSSVV